MRSSNIDGDTFVYGNEDVFVDENAVNIPYVKSGDILITSANGSSRLVGKHAIIKDLPMKSAVHGGFMLAASSEKPEFVNALMGAPWYASFINLFVAGGNGAIGNLSKSDLDDQVVYVPESKEQDAIGSFFEKLDNLITLHQRKLKNTSVFFIFSQNSPTAQNKKPQPIEISMDCGDVCTIPIRLLRSSSSDP